MAPAGHDPSGRPKVMRAVLPFVETAAFCTVGTKPSGSVNAESGMRRQLLLTRAAPT